MFRAVCSRYARVSCWVVCASLLICAGLPVLGTREHLCSEVCAALPVPGMFQGVEKKCPEHIENISVS